MAVAVKAMRTAIAKKRWGDAKNAFEDAVRHDPVQAPYTEWADTLAARGDVKGAVDLYKVVLSDPKKFNGTVEGYPPPARVMRYCLLLLRVGNAKAAHEAYERGFELTRNYPNRFEGLRDLLDLKPLTRPVEPATLQAAAYTIIGLTNNEARTWDEHRMPPDVAIAEYQKALAVKPDFDVARLFLGKAYKMKEFLEPGSGALADAAWQAAERSPHEAIRAKARELRGNR